MELNLEELQELVNQQREETDFYKEAVRVISTIFNIGQFFSVPEMKAKWHNLDVPREFYQAIADGKVPSDDAINAVSTDDLDVIIQDSCFVTGIVKGVASLHREGDCEEYIAFLMRAQQNKKYFIVSHGFAALTLLGDCPPSDRFLERCFPLTDDEEMVQTSLDLIAEINSRVLQRYIEMSRGG